MITTKFDIKLAKQIAFALESGHQYCHSHRDYCGQGLYLANGKYHIAYFYDGFPDKAIISFTSRSDFISYLSELNDWVCEGYDKSTPFFTESSFIRGNQTLRKEELESFAAMALGSRGYNITPVFVDNLDNIGIDIDIDKSVFYSFNIIWNLFDIVVIDFKTDEQFTSHDQFSTQRLIDFIRQINEITNITFQRFNAVALRCLISGLDSNTWNKLEHLFFDNCTVTKQDLFTILNNASNLTTLDINNTNVRSGAGNFILKDLNALRYVHLNNAHAENDSIELYSEILSKTQNLTELNISNSNWLYDSIIKLNHTTLKNLVTLNIENLTINKENLKRILLNSTNLLNLRIACITNIKQDDLVDIIINAKFARIYTLYITGLSAEHCSKIYSGYHHIKDLQINPYEPMPWQ